MYFHNEDSPEFSQEGVCQHSPEERKEIAQHCKYMVNNSCIIVIIQ